MLLLASTLDAGAPVFQGVPGSRVADEWGGKPATNGDTDAPMYLDPYLAPVPIIKRFHPGLEPRWRAALGRPDTETRCAAAQAITKARRLGMPGLEDMAGDLAAFVETRGREPLVPMAAARALIALDARGSAAALLRRNKEDGLVMILLTDPALARWDHQPARAVWMGRLDSETDWSARISAIEALGAVRHEAAADALLALATDPQAVPPLRLAAAAALAEIASEGLESTARRLAGGSTVDRLAAAALLGRHDGEDAVALLLELAADAEPTVAGGALRRLLAIDPLLIEPMGSALLSNPDAEVRRLAVEGVLAQKTPAAIALLGPRLNDVNPRIRRAVRRRLVEQDREPALTEPIREAAMTMLEGGAWRGLEPEALAETIRRHWRGREQAAMLLGAVDHKPAADCLVDLLSYPRVEVRTVAAAALRRLAIPRTLAPMLAYAQRAADWQAEAGRGPQSDEPEEAWDRSPNGKWLIRRRPDVPDVARGIPRRRDLDDQMAQIMQAFGLMTYGPAEPLMRRHVPKHCGHGSEARGAAVWALGKLHLDEPDTKLAAQLAERLADINPLDPEKMEVRRMSAVTIGFMRAEDELDTLEVWYERQKLSVDIHGATRWSIMRMTGRDLPQREATLQEATDFFLGPIDKLEKDEYLLAEPME
ncbi:MAG: hypothetical protein CMJ18_05310 [Phycisphaeraceae bacterium]|nr:hypothetical protein [Phycisphaeraceae bacterium]